MKVVLSQWAQMPGNIERVFGRLRGCSLDVPDIVARTLLSEGLVRVDDGPVRVLAPPPPPKPPTSEAELARPAGETARTSRRKADVEESAEET